VFGGGYLPLVFGGKISPDMTLATDENSRK
jgi:hypothetical protein